MAFAVSGLGAVDRGHNSQQSQAPFALFCRQSRGRGGLLSQGAFVMLASRCIIAPSEADQREHLKRSNERLLNTAATQLCQYSMVCCCMHHRPLHQAIRSD